MRVDETCPGSVAPIDVQGTVDQASKGIASTFTKPRHAS